MWYQLYLWTSLENYHQPTAYPAASMVLEHLLEVLVIDHKRKYSIFVNACFQNSGHHKNVMSLRVIKNVSCIYFLRPLLDRLWVIVYILHFMVQSPCSVFIVPSHKIWTWCGQNKFCMLLLPLGDSWLKEQVRLDEIRNQFGLWKRNLQAFLCYRIKVSL